MRKNYSTVSLTASVLFLVYVLFVYAILIIRICSHQLWMYRHGRHIGGISIMLDVFVFAVFVFSLYRFAVGIFLRLYMITIDGGSIIITPLNPFKSAITIPVNNISMVGIIANKTKPVINFVTGGNEINIPVLTNYLELQKVRDAFMALGIPMQVSGPSAHLLERDKRKLRRTVVILYTLLFLFLAAFLAKVLFHMSRHH